jgi:hypothetical protein
MIHDKKKSALGIMKTPTAASLQSLRLSQSHHSRCTVESVEMKSQQRMNRPVDATSQNRHDVRFVY